MKKNIKLLTILVLVFLLSISTLVACKHEHTYAKDWSTDAQYHWYASTCGHDDAVSYKGAHEDVNKDGVCDICNYASCIHTFAEEWSSNVLGHWHAPTCGHDVKGSEGEHVDANSDGLCDVCSYQCGDHVHTYADGWTTDKDSHWHAATCVHSDLKKSLGAHMDTNGDFICDMCKYVIHEHTAEEAWTTDIDGHWHAPTCDHTTVKVDYAVHEDADADNKCDVCKSPLYEKVTYTFTVEDKEPQKAASDLVYGIFTVGTGAEIRNRTKSFSDSISGINYDFTKSVKVNGSTAAFYLNAAGTGKLTLIVQNGSSGATTQILKMYAPDSDTAQEIEYPGTSEGSPMLRLDINIDQAGVYKFQCGGTTDIYHAIFTAVVEKSNLSKIEVTNTGVVNYVIGDTLDTSALIVEKVYENLRTEVLSEDDYVLDISAYNKNSAGEYEIGVTYTADGKEYKTSYTVTVYAVEDITLNENAIREVKKGGTDSAASPYNGSYANSHLRHIYLKGEALSLEGLTVTVHGVCGDKKLDFVYVDGFETTGYNKDTVGEQTITVSLLEKSKTFKVFVTDVAVDKDVVVNCAVVPSATDMYATISGVHTFRTINDALQFLEALNLPKDTEKRISISEGTYNEKVEITIPSLTIIGAGADKVKIEWDSLYGLKDESGYTHTTDSTQTMAIRYNAECFTMSGVTVSNKWNNQQVFDDELGAGYSEHRALALLCQADKVYIYQTSLLGYQDTVEFFTGRQLLVECYISGTTDFIFGSDNTTYFYNSTIHSIATFDNKGGYITAFKGNNGSGAVKYGAIFDKCTFTCDEGVAQYSETDASAKGLTAIGRPWGQDAAVAVINSNLGAHISKEASTGAARQERYVTMSGNMPANANYVEYNNTGLSAITASQTGVTILTADEAAKYSDLFEIFGVQNGAVSYKEVWVGRNDKYTLTVKDSEGNEIGSLAVLGNTSATFEQLSEVVAVPDGLKLVALYYDQALTQEYDYIVNNTDVTLYASFESADPTIADPLKVVLSDGSTDVLGQQVPAGQVVTYKKLTIDTTGMNSDKVFKYNGSGWYILDGGFKLGMKLNKGSIVSMHLYNNTDVSVIVNGATAVALDATAFSGDSGNYILNYTATEDGDVTFVFGSQNYARYVQVIPTVVENTTIDLTGLSEKIEKATGSYSYVLVDATNGKFALNSSADWVQINAGTILTIPVVEGAKVSFVEYNNAGLITCVVENGVATLTATGNTYISSITITVPSKAVTHTLDGDKIALIGNSNLPADFAIDDFFTATVNVKAESIKITGASYEADGLTFEGAQVSLTKGKVQCSDGVWSNSISFTVEEGKTAKVVVYAAQKSDKTTKLKILDASATEVVPTDIMINGVSATAWDQLPIASVNKYEFTLSAGTYHIGGAGGGAYIYGMTVTVE